MYKKVFVFVPAKIPCGGVELAHQLVDFLQSNKQDAYIVYAEDMKNRRAEPVMDVYKRYNIITTIEIEDAPQNILVLPEIAFDMAKLYPNMKIACWWMSVDNFVQHELHYHQFHWNTKKNIYQNIRKWIHVMIYHLPIKAFDILDYLRKQQSRVIHLYQSQYACEYIKRKNLTQYYPLSDYINLELLPQSTIDKTKKENIILYNPKKGLEFTQKLRASIPEYSFIALEGMTRQELNAYFDKAKLYIDFGHFPGKDRLPREAVMHDCCIITGKDGAAAFFEDVPISDEYKFESKITNIPAIKNKIIEIMNSYDVKSLEFEEYKKIVLQEQNIFHREIESLFL